MYLETKYAEAIVSMLEDAQDIGMSHVVLQTRGMDRGLEPNDICFFDTAGAALEYLDEIDDQTRYLPADAEFPHYYLHVDRLLEQIKEQNQLYTKEISMNYNNLENLKEELGKLGFGKKVIDAMEKNMKENHAEFQVHERVKGSKEQQIDLVLHFKQSGQSDNYYLNKFDVRLLNGKALGEGEKFMVVNPEIKKDGVPVVKNFELAKDAIAYFKMQDKDATLAAGKDWANKRDLAVMEKGNVNRIDKDFTRTYKQPDVSQTVFVERGKGFTAEQAVNLIQGRAVFRDDLVKLNGEPYKAWNKLDMDNQKDRYQNFQLLQYHVPTYGFELDKVLNKFDIKEMGDDKKREALMTSLENGNRPLVTVLKEGKEEKLFMETSPRYSQLNFFREDGKPEKREQFLKEEFRNEVKIGQDKTQNKQQEQGMAV